jgi:hypothetical protein
MKLAYLSIVTALVLTAAQAEVSWYVGGFRNMTCTGQADGQISCEAGHKYDAPEVIHISTLPITFSSPVLNLTEGFSALLDFHEELVFSLKTS